ncbi:MAG: tRNA dihydrouridine synthase DusB [Alphaproteobacteria bacterium]|nr:tRNA dihydrouridine synthase DusB [Alphaproteobacteria bacterium]
MQALGFKSKVFLAPMAGITDLPMRRLVASIGGGQMVSEMVAINSVQYKNPKSYRIADVRSEPYPVVVQLLGNEPELFAEVVPLIEEMGAHSIDINMGCPVKKITANNTGSALMKDISLAAKIVESAVKASKLKVSVKFRKGWDNNSVNAVEFAKMCEDKGAAYVTVHGRTRSEFYSGKADWDIIKAVKESVKIPVIGNGDVNSPQKAQEMLAYTGVDAVMVGRAALGNPWMVPNIHQFLETGEELPKPTVQEIKQVLLKHMDELLAYYNEQIGLPVTRKYVCWYCKNLYDAKRFRERYNRIDNYADAVAEINDYFDNIAEFVTGEDSEEVLF